MEQKEIKKERSGLSAKRRKADVLNQAEFARKLRMLVDSMVLAPTLNDYKTI